MISDSTPCDDVVIIGYGNTLRGDDGLGWIAAEFLAGVIQPCQAWVITCHQLTIDLAEALSKSTLAILIDACVGAEPGLITCDEIQPAGMYGSAVWARAAHDFDYRHGGIV